MSIIKKLIPNKENLQKLKTSAEEKGLFCKQQTGNLTSALSKNKKVIFIFGGVLVVVIVLMLVLPSEAPNNKSGQLVSKPSARSAVSSSKTQAGDYIKQRLQDISDQLITIKGRLEGSGAASFTSINQQLTNLIGQTKALSSESNKMITKQIQESTAQLKKQLVVINADLIKLQQEQEHIKYLKPNNLPFKVVSIDNIQQSNVVTISYNNTIFPIEIDSYVAGWKLIRADFVGQKAEFVNAKKQHVIVDLNRMQKRKGDDS